MRVRDVRIGTMPYEECVGLLSYLFPNLFMLPVGSGSYLVRGSGTFTLTPTLSLKGRGSDDPQSIRTISLGRSIQGPLVIRVMPNAIVFHPAGTMNSV